MKKRWLPSLVALLLALLWVAVSALIILYAQAGYVSVRTDVITVKLDPGYSAKVPVFRFADDRLRMELVFHGEHKRRPELGIPGTRGDWHRTGILKYDHPGAAIRIAASLADAAPVTYEAMPTSGYTTGQVFRNLTSSLSVAPGIWQWPPDQNELVLHSGTSLVTIEIVSVDPKLVGETVELWVKPGLGYATASNVVRLWSLYLSPVFVAIQLAWAFVLGRWILRMRRRVRQEADVR
jgi:hypothetical protein